MSSFIISLKVVNFWVQCLWLNWNIIVFNVIIKALNAFLLHSSRHLLSFKVDIISLALLVSLISLSSLWHQLWSGMLLTTLQVFNHAAYFFFFLISFWLSLWNLMHPIAVAKDLRLQGMLLAYNSSYSHCLCRLLK